MLLHLAQNPGQLLSNEFGNVVVLLVLLLVLSAVLLSARVFSAVLLSTVVLLAALVSRVPSRTTMALVSRSMRLAALEIDVYPASILLCTVLETQFAAYLLNLGLDFLHMAGRVMPLANDGMEMCLASGLVCTDALLEDALRFLYELTVEVDAVGLDATRRVVLAEDEVGGLAVVFIHLAIMRLAFVGQLFGRGTVAVIVGSTRLFLWLAPSRIQLREGKENKRTRSKQALRFSASARAKSRRRSYSCSAASSSPE